MISPRCDLRQFLEKVAAKDYLEVIGLADREATEAERLRFRGRQGSVPLSLECSGYPERIKGLIHYLRYGVRNSQVRQEDVELLMKMRERLLSAEPDDEEDCEQGESPHEAGGSPGERSRFS